MVFSVISPPHRHCVSSYGGNRKQISNCRQSQTASFCEHSTSTILGCRSHVPGRSSPLKTVRIMARVLYVFSNQPVTRSFSLPTAHSPKMRTLLSSSQKKLKLHLRAQTPLSLTTVRLLLPPAVMSRSSTCLLLKQSSLLLPTLRDLYCQAKQEA